MISNCCGAKMYDDSDICSECKDHCQSIYYKVIETTYEEWGKHTEIRIYKHSDNKSYVKDNGELLPIIDRKEVDTPPLEQKARKTRWEYLCEKDGTSKLFLFIVQYPEREKEQIPSTRGT